MSTNLIDQIRNTLTLIKEHRPLDETLIHNLHEWFKVELTFSSNALEGNTLSRMETALVVQKGITIGGKLLKEHLEATNHAKAYDFILNFANKKIELDDVLAIHKIVLSTIDDDCAGKLRTVPVRISGANVVFPNHQKLNVLMQKFVDDLNKFDDPIHKAIFAHYELVTIHPFVDGNGRTARLLMNLILIKYGFAPVIIKPKERLMYLKTLEKAQLGGSRSDFDEFILKRILSGLSLYLKSIQGIVPKVKQRSELIKIGELSTQTQETLATLRHWVKIGLIEVYDTTESGYQLFAKNETKKCKKIRELQKQRYSNVEILEIFSSTQED